ncbi:hypothetical protein TGAM01_v210854 [Trichoderma gamsii]|uniref:Uncharacterized protein n=1 Tax=Trichoderma gamsii TaxID=398673 RepID=A0A2P4Z7K1_9HYPO|nr:hypothetical protein TGAM01_v210854 [Trichoderma gamsii]PON20258.1 hypothetical protein TGAM01_v210854 [Trichoderma gamsii]
MLFNEIITILSDSELEIEADAAANGEGSLQCNEAWPSVDTASLYTAAAQMDEMNETQKHGAVSPGANEANGFYQLDLLTIGQFSEESIIDTIFLALCPDSSIQTPKLPSISPAFRLP